MTLYFRNSSSGRFAWSPACPGWILISSAMQLLADPVPLPRDLDVGRLDPGQVALRPHVDVADDQDPDEDEHLDEQEERVLRASRLDALLARLLEKDRPRVEERDLDVEDQEDQRDRVEADVEAHPAGADRRLAALVRRALRGILDRRSEEPAQDRD